MRWSMQFKFIRRTLFPTESHDFSISDTHALSYDGFLYLIIKHPKIDYSIFAHFNPQARNFWAQEWLLHKSQPVQNRLTGQPPASLPPCSSAEPFSLRLFFVCYASTLFLPFLEVSRNSGGTWPTSRMPILMVSLSVVSLASMALGRMYPYSRQSSSLTPSQDPLRWTSTQLTPFCSMSTILWMKQPLYITTECFSTAPRILTVHRVFLNGSFTLSRWSRAIAHGLLDSGIPPGGDFDYVVPINSSGQWGTYWVHAHASVRLSKSPSF